VLYQVIHDRVKVVVVKNLPPETDYAIRNISINWTIARDKYTFIGKAMNTNLGCGAGGEVGGARWQW